MVRLSISSLLPLSLVLLVACESGPRYIRPKTSLPELDAKVDVSKFLREKWWEIFNSPVLNQLEEKALKNNSDMKQAIENVEIAMAQADAAFGDLLPSIAATGTGGKSRISGNGNSYTPGMASRSARSYDAQLKASYEIDLFGKYRSANDASRAALLSTTAAKQVVLLSITSQVAKTYFMIRALEAKLQIARRTLSTRKETYTVYKNRYKSGYCTQLDFLRVKSELYSVKSMVLSLEKALASAETSISVLLGCSPKEMYGWKLSDMKATDRLNISVTVPNGVPADILVRRPDILAAEGQLMAANAEIGRAASAHFPSLSLTGALGFESKSLSNLFNPVSDILQFGGGLALPLFSGGKIMAMTHVAKAAYRKQLAVYRQTVRVAFKETLDALTEYRINTEIEESRNVQVDALRKSYAIAKSQENVGMIGMIDLLDVERGLLAAEIELVEAQFSRLSAIIDVCKAFGGGWTILKLKGN